MTPEQQAEYVDLNFSFWDGPDDGEIVCRKVKIVKARKQHPCAYFGPAIGPQHFIEPGEYYAQDSARYDGAFGTCRTCLKCLDRWRKEAWGSKGKPPTDRSDSHEENHSQGSDRRSPDSGGDHAPTED